MRIWCVIILFAAIALGCGAGHKKTKDTEIENSIKLRRMDESSRCKKEEKQKELLVDLNQDGAPDIRKIFVIKNEKQVLLCREADLNFDGIKDVFMFFDENGQIRGNGMLSLELIALDKLGYNLSKNPYALNETLRVLIRVAVPFIVVFILSYITRSDDKAMLDRFFVKMKTEVLPDKEKDEKHIAMSYSNPSRYDHLRMFPKTQLEITKWSKVDILGFAVSCCIAAGIVMLLALMVNFGK